MTRTMSIASAPSLKSRLLRSLLPILLGAMVVSGALSYFGAQYYVNQVFDRVLVDTLNGLSSRILVRENRVVFDFPEAAQKIFEWDIDDAAYFRISSRENGHIAGQPDLVISMGTPSSTSGHQVHSDVYRGQRIRVASRKASLPGLDDQIQVTVAETTNSRELVTQEIFFTVLVPQILLIALAVIIILQTMRRAIEPVSEAARDLERRTQHSQEPLDDSQIPEEIRPLTKALNDVLIRLQQALALQRQFVADAAHQLRTPLTALQLHLENALLMQHIEDARPILMQVQIAAQRATRLSEQLLLLAESEERLLRGERDTFPPLELLEEIAAFWQPRAAQREIQLTVSGTPDHNPIITSHRDLLIQVLDNLVDNALRYCPEGSSLDMHLDGRNANQVQITLTDNGPGIAQRERQWVTRRFYRGDADTSTPTQSTVGSGLGLAIAHDIMTRLGGSLGIGENPSGTGTCITLTLPRDTRNPDHSHA